MRLLTQKTYSPKSVTTPHNHLHLIHCVPPTYVFSISCSSPSPSYPSQHLSFFQFIVIFLTDPTILHQPRDLSPSWDYNDLSLRSTLARALGIENESALFLLLSYRVLLVRVDKAGSSEDNQADICVSSQLPHTCTSPGAGLDHSGFKHSLLKHTSHTHLMFHSYWCKPFLSIVSVIID
jgi:hypothetical protein